MRKLTYLFVILIMLLMGACSKDGFDPGNSDQMGGDDFLKAGHGAKVIVVSPDGDDNTQDLLNAFNQAKLLGPGVVVQLVEGVYDVGFMEIVEFKGTLKGVGMGKTIIKALPDLPCHERVTRTGCIPLITFIGGDIKIIDLSVKMDDGFACISEVPGFGRDLYAMVGMVDDLHGIYSLEKNFVNAWIDRVEFVGGVDDYYESGFGKYNVMAAIWFGHDFVWPASPSEKRANGNLTVTNCTFKNVVAGLNAAGMSTGNMLVRNSMFPDLYHPLMFFDCLNTECIISNNQFSKSKYFDIFINNMDYSVYGAYQSETPAQNSSYRIAGNVFDTYNSMLPNPSGNPSGVSIYLLDLRASMYPSENMPMQCIVENNRINLNEGAKGIVGLNNKNGMFLANKFSGNGTAGISIDGDAAAGVYASGNKLLGNKFVEAENSEADIVLGPNTTKCLVAGSSMADIDDNGVDNKITGPLMKD